LWNQLAAGRFAQPGSNDLLHARWMMLGCWAAGLLGCWHSTEIGSIMQSVMQWCSSAAMGKTLPADDASGLRVWNTTRWRLQAIFPVRRLLVHLLAFWRDINPDLFVCQLYATVRLPQRRITAAADLTQRSIIQPSWRTRTAAAQIAETPTAADSASTRAPSARAAGTVDSESRAGWRREDYQRRNRQHSIHS
jgi:hypothetical protein